MELEFATDYGLVDDSMFEIGTDIDTVGYENERCGICMDVIIDRGVLECCEHWFCFACIDNWATITNLCPLCQKEFQMITCVPVYDTIGSGKVDDDSISRDDDWCIQGTNNTLSFPSYYIDENAVICLNGNGCKLRNGAATSGDDSILDTSIACDSCDIWYHAFCVDFDPESTSEISWLCPRCIHDVPLQSDGSSKLMRNNQYGQESASHEHLLEDSHSGKVSVSVADAGETAVVVSMIDRDHCIKELRENSLSVGGINKNNQTLGKESNIQPSVDAEETSLALSLSYDTHFSVPCDTLPLSESKIDFVDEAVSEPNVSDGCKLFTELSSSKPKNDREPSEIESNVDLYLGLSLRSSLPDNSYSDTTEYDPSEVSQTQKLVNECSLSVDNMGLDANEDGVVSSCVKRKSMSSRDHVLVTELAEADTMFPRDELGTEPPAKKAKAGRKSQQTHVEHEVREPVSGSRQECTHPLESSKDEVDIVSIRYQLVDNVPAKKAKVDGKSRQKHSTSVVQKSISEGEQGSTHISAVSGDDKSKDVEEQIDSASDIMSIVRGTHKRPGRLSLSNPADKLMKERDTGAGLRVKKILRRAPEDESSKLEKLRKEIREAVRNRALKDDGQSKLFDPKLLLAFRNAIAGPRPEREPVRRLNPSFVRSKKSLLQKGKIRENLTKKIYGNSNGKRRRAWDRDWEVEFWKHRCGRATKPEKVETLKSVLDLLRRGPETSEMENERGDEASNPILSRLYLADTSVFPRSDDIKPLSALTVTRNNGLNKGKVVNEKDYKPTSDICIQNHNQASKSSLQDSKDEASCKTVYSNGSMRNQDSMSMASGSQVNDQPLKEMAGKSDVKSDKRKWALEVLARKASAVDGNSTQGKPGDSTMLKGSFPLLAQLPPDMRPILTPIRHNKVPMSVRQAQLHRLIEHFLRKANLPVVRRTADTELAVADAVNIEKEVVTRSNSKLVYLNLCAQALARHTSSNRHDTAAESDPSQPAVDPEITDSAGVNSSDLSAEAALRMAGLVSDSPPNSPYRSDVNDDNQLVDEDKGPENVFDIDSHAELDIYGDFEYDLDSEDYIGGIVPKVSKPQPEEGDSKMKVVFSTLNTRRSDNDMDPKDIERLEVVNDRKGFPFLEVHKGIEISVLDVRTENSCPTAEPLQDETRGDPSWAECEELYGPDKEPLVERFPDKASGEAVVSSGKEVCTEDTDPKKDATCTPDKAGRALDFDHESCADNKFVRSGLPADCGSSGGENSANHSLVKKNIRRNDKKTNKTKPSDNSVSVSRKVEAYIKEHIRPLCKSGVITVEQYRWAVEKTTSKIMRYHSRDSNANFLIKEGEKVKKLAEQYVEAAQVKPIVPDLNVTVFQVL
ncbi:hypothetical protein IFM89_034247 [Coptis chinensis]|uniref:Uncharacterized protein n=1 Tax=Coptis chinensis TaxID=261450 RepID=A0A835LH73_9MAGN|nr:hypothetical protein IFM89_034247 [Coptis chinensis]